ncbi:MAG: fibronectin type III domain-containing protein [Bacteroidota bacterium]|nr:fibronectin type III domain-containing protein [Bacteroidota bacterium]MDP4242345.1 fibronectin type III domain-containing protein [Bacteroidota bacterium]MDP4288702.1 fibronectin type III domain-containing protein [Bacteroidota bacterium]
MFLSNQPSRKSLVTLSYLVLSFSSFLFSGCLSDPITGPEVRPRLVLPPQRVMFTSPVSSFVAPATGDMVIRWTRSTADTQLNFKGYYVKVWTSQPDTDQLGTPSESDLQLVDTAHIAKVAGRIDTSVTFHTLPLGRYTAVVWGEKATDTLGYSLDSARLHFDFDPRPLMNPTNLRATSTSPTTVQLRWDLPSTNKNIGMFGYIVYYHDPIQTRNDSGHYAQFVPAGDSANTATVTIPPLLTPLRGASEHPYRMWVKAIRKDSAMFYGSDTNEIVWAGAEINPPQAFSLKHDSIGNPIPDSGYHGFRHSIFMGRPANSQNWGIADDSTNQYPHQVALQISGNTLSLNTLNGAAFLSDGGLARMDTAFDLTHIYYAVPYNDPSQFTINSVTLTNQSSGTGVVLYLMFKDADPAFPANEWARIFILRQADGTFVNHSGGVDIQVSFQPGVTQGGTSHLPYY